ncbi:MAG: UDP-2,3-diacylglucosamine diphosphatase [Rikenellaceae bacterium]
MAERSSLYYFVSDVHLGLKAFDPGERELKFAKFLRELPPQTKAVYLIGDIFDFWFEYKYVVPRGFTRVLGALSSLSDRGVRIFFFKGNHDMWTFGYLEKEIGLEILKEPSVIEIEGKKFCLAHGDELTALEPSHLFLKKMFHSKFLQFMLATVHPRWTFAVAYRWSKNSRLSGGGVYKFRGEEEPLYKYACDFEERENVDYFIFGHIHTPGNIKTPLGAEFYILGEWIHGCEYLCYDSAEGKMRWLSGNQL